MNDEKKDQDTSVEEKGETKEETKSNKRTIIIETDGTNVNLVKDGTAGKIELIGVLQSLTAFLMNNK